VGDDGKKKYEGHATSGRPGATAADQGTEDYGPIPEGTYTFKPSDISTVNGLAFVARGLSGIPQGHPWSDWGHNRVTLSPSAGNQMGSRNGFFLHGGSKPGSAGCIDVGRGEGMLFPLLKSATSPVTVIVSYPSPSTITTPRVP
jgi:hypothetical protein